MTWETPKTDWHGERDEHGNYKGDRFNAADFNRIKNNLQFLRDKAITLYNEFDIVSLGEDRTPRDYYYADEINQLEDNLNTVNSHTFRKNYGSAPRYVDNGNTPNFAELNRLEGAILDIYNKLTTQAENRRTLVWNFGIKGGL